MHMKMSSTSATSLRGGLLLLNVLFAFVILQEVTSSPTVGPLVPRIIGGVPITSRCRAPYNWMVALQFPARFNPVTFCSAVMVTDTYLVTTASCILAMKGRDRTYAVVGEQDTILKGEPGEQKIAIKSTKIHPYYDKKTGANNIGLIELAQTARLSGCVKPAARMEKDPKACEDTDETCQIIGWGSYAEIKQPYNSRLARAAAVTVYSELITLLLAVNSKELPPVGSLYAETRNVYQKACYFDWGGVVSCTRNGNNVLRGVIIDHNCDSQRAFPILILDIPYYQDWIDECTTNWATCLRLDDRAVNRLLQS